MREFVTILIRMLMSLIGIEATRLILKNSFPTEEFFINELAGLGIQGFSKDNAQKLVRTVTEYVIQNFGEEFAHNLLSKSYANLKKEPHDQPQLLEVLDIVPNRFLEEEKIKMLSKEELEQRVLERTRELQELNKTLEQRVIERTKELAKANGELEEKNKRLEDLSRAKTEFVSLVSHQILTPLSSLRMALYEFQDMNARSRKKTTQELIQSMIATNERLIELTENLLNVARIEEGRLLYTFQQVAVGTLIQEVIESLKQKAKEKNLSLRYAEPRYALPAVSADKEKLYLVIENIIANAINYTPEKKKIEVQTSLNPHSLSIIVKDQGIGIPEKDQKDIFQKFFRAPNAVQEGSGTGLGLFIAKQIMESHGGTISFESREGKGTTFTIEIPISTSQSMPTQPIKSA